MAATPPPSDKLPRGKKSPQPGTDPDSSNLLPDSHTLGELAGFDDQGTDLMPLPEGALDDLPAPAPSAASSWLGKEALASNESDVIRGLSLQPPPGSSNIFDTGPGGSSRFTTPSGGTESLTGDQPRPSNDVLYNDLANPAEPSSVVFSGDELFAEPGVRQALRPNDDSDHGRLPGDTGSRPSMNVTDASDQGSNLFADPTAADLDLDDNSQAVPLGADPHSDADLARTGPGSSIFAGGFGPQGSALDVDRIPVMASADDARAEELPFDSPPPSGIGNDIFGSAGKPLRPSGVGAVAFDLPVGAVDDDATERSDGGVDMDIPEPSPSTIAGSSQRSRRMVAEDIDGMGSSVLRGQRLTSRKSPAPVTGPAPLADTEPARRGVGGWIGGGVAGLLAGAGATVAAGYLGGFLGADAPPPKSPPPVAVSPPPPAADTAELDRVKADAEAERKRMQDQVNAATRRVTALQGDLEKAKLPNPELATTQKKLLDALAEKDVAKKEAATANGKLEGTNKALAEASAKRLAAEATVAGVVDAMKANKLAGEGDSPVAVLAKLPDALKAATGADAQKAAAMLAELADAKKATETATKAAQAAKDELATATAKADERVKAAAAEATMRTKEELVAANIREAALRQQIAQTQQAAAAERAKLEEAHRLQLADARSGVVVPLSSAEQRAKDLSAAELGRGMTAFFAGRTPDAVGALDAAAAYNPGDARAWYFLGLAKRRANDTAGAAEAFKKGAEVERKGRTAKRDVNEALLNVQGAERIVLNTYRPLA